MGKFIPGTNAEKLGRMWEVLWKNAQVQKSRPYFLIAAMRTVWRN